MSAPDVTPAAAHSQSERAIACVEVWGGSHAFDHAVSVPGNDVRISCTPHNGDASGGDIYYISSCAKGQISRFILADVAGHGAEVAHIALSLRTLMRKHINNANQTSFAMALNKAFAGLSQHGEFATAVLATYFAPTDHLIICNAGHPRPLIYRAGTGAWAILDSSTAGSLATREAAGESHGIANLPLGILDPTDYEQFAVHLMSGDCVVLYSDALIEACDAAGRELGEAGLLAIAAALEADERRDVAKALRERVLRHAGGGPLDDDATLVVLHHNAGDPPRGTLGGQVAMLGRLLGLLSVYSGPGMDS